MQHPDFAVLTVSWELALRADGYADNTVKAYQNAVRSLADWLAEHHPEVGPAELDRQHIRGWLVEVRKRRSSNTARGWFAGVRHFCRWLQSEGEADQDATAGIRTPAPGDPETPVLSDADPRALLSTCAGTDFTARRDTAIIMLFLDGGLRLSELAGLRVADVDLRDRIVEAARPLMLMGSRRCSSAAGYLWALVSSFPEPVRVAPPPGLAHPRPAQTLLAGCHPLALVPRPSADGGRTAEPDGASTASPAGACTTRSWMAPSGSSSPRPKSRKAWTSACRLPDPVAWIPRGRLGLGRRSATGYRDS